MTRADRLVILTLGSFASLWPSVAEAHAPIEGLGTFYAYFLHPILVPEFALLVLGTALLLGQQGRSASRIGLIAMALGLVTGLLLMRLLLGPRAGQIPVLVAAIFAGTALCLDRQLPHSVPALLAFATGLLVALDPDIGTLERRDEALAMSGLVCGSLVLTVILAGHTTNRAFAWLRIARRIIGAWIVAAAALVLALAARASA